MATDNDGFIGAGDVHFNRKDPVTGLYLGWVGPLEADKFELKSNSTIKELKSKGRGTYGQVKNSVGLADPADININLRTLSPDNLALLFMGDIVTLTQASATVVDEPVTLKKGGGVSLLNQNLNTTGIVVTSSPAGTTYVRDTDYTVDLRLGILKVVAGSSLDTALQATSGSTGLPLLVDYAALAIAGYRVRGATQPQLRAWIKFDGINLANGKALISEVYEATLTPQTGLDFLGDDWANLGLGGRMSTPSGKTEPFVIDYRS